MADDCRSDNRTVTVSLMCVSVCEIVPLSVNDLIHIFKPMGR